MNPLAYIHRAAELIFDLYEASGFRTGRSVKHDVHKHDFIMQRWLCGGKRWAGRPGLIDRDPGNVGVIGIRSRGQKSAVVLSVLKLRS